MLVASISDAKNKLSALLDRVRGGESVLIVDRGRPVARLVPALFPGESEGRLARLERAGVVERATDARPAAEIVRTEPPRMTGEASAVRALIEERGEGR